MYRLCIFFQRAGIYHWTIVRAECIRSTCNPRAPPFKEVDARNPISPIAKDDYSGISTSFTHPDPEDLRRASADGPATKIVYLLELNYSDFEFACKNIHVY